MRKTDFFFDYTLYFIKISFILLPITLITGPFLPDLTVVLMALFSLVIIVYKKKQIYLKNYFVIFSLIFCAYIILRSVLSSHPYLSLESSLFYFRFIFFCICIRFLIETDRNLVKYFYYAILFSFLILLIFVFIEIFFNLKNYEFLNSSQDFFIKGRMNSLFQEEYVLGNMRVHHH